STITNEVKLYLQGRYGKALGEISPQVKHMAIGNEKVIDCRPADLLPPEMDRLRKEIDNLAKSEEDVLTYAMFPELGKEFLEQREAGKLIPEPLEPPNSESGNGKAATEFNVTLHGESYHIKVTGRGYPKEHLRPYYVTVDGVPEEILLESLDEISLGGEAAAEGQTRSAAGKRPRATSPGHVTTSMPGTIVDVLVNIGDEVNAGDPVLITEAMKMETEIQAPIKGIIKAIHVTKGQSVNPDEALVEIE
ncbi:MAG: pyruvate carboxylase subunit B, partial [Thiohalophilus sp.]